MPKKIRHLSHILMLIAFLFVALLFTASVFVPKRKTSAPVTQPSAQIVDSSEAQNPSPQDSPVPDISIDASNWKTYKDPTYRFSIEYPPEWPVPKTQKVNDPDYEYEYEADFGTTETLDGNGFEGFSVFIFPTEKCSSQNQDADPSCSTKKTKVSPGVDSADSVIEFSTMAYTYTIVPYIPNSGADLVLVKKASLEFNEAQKTFSYDSSLKAIKPVAPAKTTVAPPKPPTPIGRRGKLTGAKNVRGRLVCPHPNRKPQRSPNQGNHVDEDCCPDPDEWPNIACSYKPGDYKIMLKVK